VLGRPYLTAWQPGECAGGPGTGPSDTRRPAQYRCRMRGSATAGAPRSRRLAIIAANPRGAVYGTIVATAVIAATAGHQTPGLVLAATLATLLVFWLAHVYSDFLDHGVRQAGFDLKILPGIMARELSMLAAPALSIVFLLLGALGLLDEELAVRLALWNGVLQLLGWGIDVGRRRGQAWPRAALIGLLNGVFGVAIVILEVLLH
jgi:hypothetical protein